MNGIKIHTLWIMLLVLFATAGQAQWDNVRLIEESTSGFTIQVTYDELDFQTLHFGDQTIQVPSLTGATPRLEVGKPILPSQTIMFAAPPSAEIELEILSSMNVSSQLADVKPTPRTEVEDITDPKQAIHFFEKTDPVYQSTALWPKHLVEIAEDGFMRDRRMVILRINPMQLNPISEAAKLTKEVTVQVRFIGGEADVRHGNQKPDPYFLADSRKFFINQKTADDLGLRQHNNTVQPQTELDVKAGEAMIKVYVKQQGLYKVSYSDFLALGINPAMVDPQTLKAYVGGQQIDIYVAGEGDGTFDSGDYLVFFGEGISDPKYFDKQCYWVTYGGAVGNRVDTRDATVSLTEPVPVSFTDTQIIEQNVKFWGAMPNWQLYDNWYWEYLSAAATATYYGDIHDPDPSASTATMRAYLHGKTATSTLPDHHTRVRLNGTYVLDGYWDGQTMAVIESTTVNHSLLSDGSNQIYVNLPGDTGSVIDQQYINKFEIDYQRLYQAYDDALHFSAPASDVYEFQVAGFTDSDILIFDVTDPHEMVRLTGGSITGSGTYTLAVESVATTSSWFQAASDNGYAVPELVKVDAASSLLSTANGADYIIITHEDLYSATLPLISRRQAQGLRAMAVKIEDIYDEFTDGVEDPMAMQSFLEYAYYNWTPPAPLYVLLIGDATIDYLDYLSTGVYNLVPSYFVSTVSLGATPADNPFFKITGDSYPDFYSGRVPAEDVAYVNQFIDKLVNYEDASLASWHEEAAFVADNGSTTFEYMSEELITSTPGDFGIERIYIDDLGGPGAKTALSNAINNGRLIVNYFGHGSVENWAGELIMQSSDVPNLTNGYLMPFITVFNCLNGFFPLAEVNRYCLAEAFIRYQQKGAVASYGPTGYGFTSEHFVLSQRLWNILFMDNIHLELGAATTLARIEAYGSYGVSYEIVDTYILFGDPYMSLKRDLTKVDSDADGFTRDVDCDDLDDQIYPGAAEICDGKDNNCNDTIDEEPAASASCDDSVSCTDDVCVAGSCQNAPNSGNCNDSVSCTDDVCDALLDCQFTANDNNCNDGVDCTNDSCHAVNDCQYAPDNGNCNDAVSCTDDVCDLLLDCQYTPNDNNCNDGVDCTNDSCHAQNDCQYVPYNGNCNDSVSCTDDVCDALLDCQFTANDNNCNDGVDCTNDSCHAQNDCQYVPDNGNCNDNVTCTDDVCNSLLDCQYTPNDTYCDDGAWCNGSETCDSSQDCQTGQNQCDPVSEICNEVDDACECAAGFLCVTFFMQGLINGDEHSCTTDVSIELYTVDIENNPDQLAYQFTGLTLDNSAKTEIDLVSEGVAIGNYYVVIRHFNHLDLMTDNPIAVSVGVPAVEIDFSEPSNVECGVNTLYNVGGVQCSPAGDINNDGKISLADFTFLRNNWTSTDPQCDLDCDGYCRLGDFNLLRLSWNKQDCAPD